MTVTEKIKAKVLTAAIQAEPLKGRPMKSGFIGEWESPLHQAGLEFTQAQFIDAVYGLFTDGHIDISQYAGSGSPDFRGDRHDLGEFLTHGEFCIEVNPSGKDLYDHLPKGGTIGF